MKAVAELYLSDVRERMAEVRRLGDRALSQLDDAGWHRSLAGGGNSAAVLVQHLSGNMHARWGGLRGGYRPDYEGEPASRDRDSEFEESGLAPAELQARWDDGWAVFLDTLDHLTPEDLTRTLTIRGEPHTVLSAVQRQVAHYSGHVYQLVLIVKTLRGDQWQTLSIPRGQSVAYITQMHAAQAAALPDSDEQR
ncbi:DUF1572 domain-containing protein [Deinococcus deserti]|uniref:DUF1572 domain-containing protein n=1 Tax=Deinococcus deserti (strain DSM 17065 / CIP 109153 / LMG 22923 / VCD115) TaxID=546414 RepID=C1D1P5_DEIDV|nr:DUF1572 family protein [Deinococcus deserti]ACO45769.1 hypothetical protein Deide_08930 [Deinococcus deserti VCD115]